MFKGQQKWNCLRSDLVWNLQSRCSEEREAGEANRTKTELCLPNLQLSLILLLSSQEPPGELVPHLIQFFFLLISVAAPS